MYILDNKPGNIICIIMKQLTLIKNFNLKKNYNLLLLIKCFELLMQLLKKVLNNEKFTSMINYNNLLDETINKVIIK